MAFLTFAEAINNDDSPVILAKQFSLKKNNNKKNMNPTKSKRPPLTGGA